ncbi:hypothetical protein [Komagataeibacter oboediens]|uniref:hypothetical protein n=1 Tax=Komagataeibacter oboediens TaxID=65958 RepID=UPI0004949A77|nr:hypothetical protein [Komagataeibacter oboediens]
MRVRKQDSSGDMVFGHGSEDYYYNTPAGVGQLVLTRLKLWLGEWFLDTSDGTPWTTKVLGNRTTSTYDAVIRARILGTPGVSSISSYSSTLNNRKLTISATIQTEYGTTTVTTGS